MAERYDVAIVGYGPVGETLAVLLGQRGWRVAVLEKQPAPYPMPRAVHFDHEVGRILQATGVADEIAALSEPAALYEWRNAAGETLMCFGSKSDGYSGWPDGNMFTQPDLERLLDVRARALPAVEVQRGAEVIGIEQDADGVALAIASPDGGQRTVHARYALGCDGANSFTRQHVGATVSDLGFFFDWLIVDLLPHQPRTWEPLNWQLCDPARPTTLVSGGPGRRRWEFMRLPHETLDELNRADTAWRLLAPWGVDPSNATLERHAVYRFQARWVDTWRRGRVLLAGDAAHQMPPFAGQGLCSGLRDAANLAWKLDWVLAGRVAEALLDTYASERLPHVTALIHFSIELGKVICIADPAEAAARDARMIEAARAMGTVPPPHPLALGPGLWREGDAAAGRLFVQGIVERGDQRGRFDDIVGRGWTLVGRDGDPAAGLDAEHTAFFAALGGVSAHVGAVAPVVDAGGSYARWFDSNRAAVVLQRPDFHVFGAAAAADGAAGLLSALRQQLAWR